MIAIEAASLGPMTMLAMVGRNPRRRTPTVTVPAGTLVRRNCPWALVWARRPVPAMLISAPPIRPPEESRTTPATVPRAVVSWARSDWGPRAPTARPIAGRALERRMGPRRGGGEGRGGGGAREGGVERGKSGGGDGRDVRCQVGTAKTSDVRIQNSEFRENLRAAKAWLPVVVLNSEF